MDDTHAEDNNIVINESMAKADRPQCKTGTYHSPGKPGTEHRLGSCMILCITMLLQMNASPMIMYGEPENANYMTVRLKQGVDLGAAMRRKSGR